MAVLTSTISGTLLGANYSGGTGTPTASDDLYLANNMTLSGGTATVNSIQQQGSGTLTIASSSATINAAINRTGSANFIFIGNGLTLTVNGAFSETGSGGWGIYGNANSSSGNLILNGQLTHNGTAYPIVGLVNVTVDGNVSVLSGANNSRTFYNINNGGVLIINGNFTTTGAFTFSPFYFVAPATINGKLNVAVGTGFNPYQSGLVVNGPGGCSRSRSQI